MARRKRLGVPSGSKNPTGTTTSGAMKLRI